MFYKLEFFYNLIKIKFFNCSCSDMSRIKDLTKLDRQVKSGDLSSQPIRNRLSLAFLVLSIFPVVINSSNPSILEWK